MSELTKFELPKYCTTTNNSLSFDENTPYEVWENVGGTLKKIGGAIQLWLGDWLNFGERKYGEKYSQALEGTNYEYTTLKDFASVAKRTEHTRKNVGMSQPLLMGQWHEIANLAEKDQEKWVVKCRDENLTVKELREAIRESKKTPTPELPEGKYSVIYADPPWDVKAGPPWASGEESKDLEYPTMSLEEIKQLPVNELAAENSHLYLWTINKYVYESYEVARGWGFDPVCLLTWTKPPHGIGLGGTYVQTTEHLLFCRKGTLEANKRIDTTWFHYKRGKHSEKPDEFRKMIEEVSPGKRIELFARINSPGWDVWGNEV